MARPFTQRLEELRERGARYVDLARWCGEVRSTAWFNNLINASNPWRVSPPSRHTFKGLAQLLNTTVPHVRQMVAEEWYDVVVDTPSERVRALAPRVDALSDDDFRLVENVIQRLQPDSASVESNGQAGVLVGAHPVD